MTDAATTTAGGPPPSSTTTRIEFQRPWLYAKQQRAIYDPRRISLIEASTKAGKTLGCIVWMVEQALFGGGAGRNYWWVAPVSTQAEIAFTRILRYLPAGSFTANRTLKTVVLMNGAIIWFKGADRPDCYDEATRVLTRRGWLSFLELRMDDEIMTRSPAGQAQWQRPTRIVHHEHDGDMVAVRSQRLDLLVTPHHRQLVARRRGACAPGRWERGKPRAGKVKNWAEEWTTADRLKPTDVIPATASWAGTDDPAFTEDRCALLGFYLAEGSAIGNASPPEKRSALVRRNGYRIFFAQSAGIKGGDKGDVRAEFAKVLSRLGHAAKPRSGGLMMWDKRLWGELVELGDKYTKRIPDPVKNLPPHKLRVLLRWLVMGDGTSRTRANGSSEMTYATVSRGLADDVQEIAIKCGMSAIIRERRPRSSRIGARRIRSRLLYIVSFPSARFNSLSSARRGRFYERVRHRGVVSCASVPNTCMLVRRNGKPCWSGNTLYGEDVHAAVIDEASRLKETAWEAVRTTLVATRGRLRIIGNVKGRRNWFYRLARRAEQDRSPDMGYHKITANDAVAAGVLVSEEIESARSEMSAHAFSELFMAEPSDDEGNPFGASHIRSCVTALTAGPPRVWGWDLGKRQDYTVGIALDGNGRACRFERFQHMPWDHILERIVQATGATPALVDSTGLGDPIVDFLQKRPRTRFEGYHFTPASKQKLMEGLAVAIQSRKVGFPEGPIVDELEEFEYEYTRTGVRYSAPDEGFDDCVCVAGGTDIRTARGVAPVEAVAVGDLVLTHAGRYRPVTAARSRNAPLVCEVNATGKPKLIITPEHPLLLAEHAAHGPHDRKQNQLEHGPPAWRAIDQGVSPGRFGTLGVAPAGVVDVEALDMLALAPDGYLDQEGRLISMSVIRGVAHINPKTAPLKRFVEVDADFCMMLGYYLAEGSVGPHSINFASHAREAPVREWLVSYLSSLGLRPGTCVTSENGSALYAGSKPLARWLAMLGARRKKALPRWAEFLPPHKQLAILHGYLLGDGSFADGGCRAVSISGTAAYQLYEISQRLGVPASLRKRRNQHGALWHLTWGSPATAIIISSMPFLAGKIVNRGPWKQDQTQIRMTSGYVAGGVRDIVEHSNVPTRVFNLSVAEDESYVANGTVVHNCSLALAVMHLTLAPMPLNITPEMVNQVIRAGRLPRH